SFLKFFSEAHFLRNHHRVLCNPVRVASRVWVLFVDCAREHLDRTHEQLAIFSRCPLQVEHEVFELLRHEIECGREFAYLCSAIELYALRKISARDRMA